jgi:hypothetical protein
MEKIGPNIYALNNIEIGIGERKSRDLLKEVARNFKKATTEFINATRDPPFAYRERQLHSILLPSISRIGKAVFVEQPVERKGELSDGWLDYWIKNKSFVFFLELKHSYISFRNKKIRQITKNKWRTAWNQLKISDNDVEKLSMGLNPIKISLMVLPYYLGSREENNLEPVKRSPEETENMLYNLLNEFKGPKPNWICLWELKKNDQGPYEVRDSFELYPCVAFIAKVDSF